MWFRNLPIAVFGVWAANRKWADQHRSSYLAIVDTLQQCKQAGLSSLRPEVLQEAVLRTGLSASKLERYFLNDLNFDLTKQHIEGLGHFRKLCLKYGLLKNSFAAAIYTHPDYARSL